MKIAFLCVEGSWERIYTEVVDCKIQEIEDKQKKGGKEKKKTQLLVSNSFIFSRRYLNEKKGISKIQIEFSLLLQELLGKIEKKNETISPLLTEDEKDYFFSMLQFCDFVVGITPGTPSLSKKMEEFFGEQGFPCPLFDYSVLKEIRKEKRKNLLPQIEEKQKKKEEFSEEEKEYWNLYKKAQIEGNVVWVVDWLKHDFFSKLLFQEEEKILSFIAPILKKRGGKW